MRCPRCGRKAKQLRTGRGPDGRLLFDWCFDCLAEVHSQALNGEVCEIQYERRASSAESLSETRAAGLRSIGISLVLWGLMLELVAAGSWFGVGSPNEGFGLSRMSRLWLFSVSGLVVTIAGAWISLSLLDRAARRKRLARTTEWMALGIGLGALVLGIAFH